MKNKKEMFKFFIAGLMYFCSSYVFPADISSSYNSVSKAFDALVNRNEGKTSFQSLLILGGGRFEGLGGAFTALANDITFFQANPAASAVLKNTELAFLHNLWIADSRIDTVSFTQRSGNLGYGASLRCFYVPFTEYDQIGQKISSGYYTETFSTLNISYNFLRGYKFKGLTLGGNLKAGMRAMPPIRGQIENGTSLKERKANAKKQNGYAVLGDFGIQLRSNLAKKFDSREPNFYFGAALKNIGVPIKGDVPPASFSTGFAYRPVKIFLMAIDFSQPINVQNIKLSGLPYGSFAAMLDITEYFSILSSFGLKGGNPRFTLGGEVNLNRIQLSANYLLDLSSQTTALNHISLGAKISLGDRGRLDKELQIERMYIEGLKFYQKEDYEKAIEIWKDILKIFPRFEPAIYGITSAEKQAQFRAEIKKLEYLE